MDEGELLNVNYQPSGLRPQVSGRSQSRCRVGRHDRAGSMRSSWSEGSFCGSRTCFEWVAEISRIRTSVCALRVATQSCPYATNVVGRDAMTLN
jgi:hypothetical protein